MIILGVDPGLANTGVAVVDTTAKKILHKETITTDVPSQNWPGRVRAILLRVYTVAHQFVPDRSAVEVVVWHGRRKGALQLATLAGAIIGFLSHYGPVEFVLPRDVKANSKGNGDPHQADALALCRIVTKKYVPTAKKPPKLAT